MVDNNVIQNTRKHLSCKAIYEVKLLSKKDWNYSENNIVLNKKAKVIVISRRIYYQKVSNKGLLVVDVLLVFIAMTMKDV